MRAMVRVAAAVTLCAFASSPANAQNFGGAFSGFNSGSNIPIQIEADRLEVRDSEKTAIYSGHVRVRQGETLLEAPELHVFYTGEATMEGVAGSAVSRIEAGPGVRVRSGDQTASGDRAIFNMAQDLVTIEGNVLLTQGQNVVRGERLVVNLATKEGRIEGGRVQTLITPSGGTLAAP